MSDFTLGQHDAAIKQLLERTERMEGDIADIKAILSEKKGERRVALWVASVVGAVIGGLTSFLAKLVA